MSAFKQLLASNKDVQVLFDPGEIDSVCSHIKTRPCAVVAGVDRYLIKPLELVTESLYRDGKNKANSEFQRAALALLETAMNVRRVINLKQNLCEESANELSEILESRWRNFVFYGASPSLFYELPKQRQQKKLAASKTRIKDELRALILLALRPAKQEKRSFKELLAAWIEAPIDNVRLIEIEPFKSYEVSVDFSDFEPKKYTRSTLQKIYSES